MKKQHDGWTMNGALDWERAQAMREAGEAVGCLVLALISLHSRVMPLEYVRIDMQDAEYYANEAFERAERHGALVRASGEANVAVWYLEAFVRRLFGPPRPDDFQMLRIHHDRMHRVDLSADKAILGG